MDKPTRPAEAPPAPQQSLAIILASPELTPGAVDYLTEACPTLSTMGATPEPSDTAAEICDALTGAIKRVSEVGFVPDTIYILCLPNSPVTSVAAVAAAEAAGLTSTVVARQFASIPAAVEYLTHPEGPNLPAGKPTQPATPTPIAPPTPEPNAGKQVLAVAAYVDNTGQVWLKPL